VTIAVRTLAAALLVAGCASTSVREPPALLTDFTPAFEVTRVWSADIGGGSKDYLGLVPTVRDSIVYAAGAGGRVSALAADTGKQLWQVELDAPISGAVGVGSTLVTVGTRDGRVIALARDTGEQRWVAKVSSEVLARPAVGESLVVAQAVDGRVFGLSSADGKRLWMYERVEPALSLRGTDPPVLTSNAVLTGFASGRVAALRMQDGKALWETAVALPRGRNEIERLVDVDASPLVFDDAIYAASFQGKLVALNPSNGNVLWSRDMSTHTGMTSDGTNLYLTNDRGYVMAFDRRNGASLWRQEALRGRGVNAPVVYDDVIVVADYEGYVHWLAREDGHFVARYQAVGSPVRAPAVVADGTVFVSGISGTLSALRLVRKQT
jgi:outer membrane protein assembly factor BamB